MLQTHVRLFLNDSDRCNWLVVEPTHLKNISQIGNLPQTEVKIKRNETTTVCANMAICANVVGFSSGTLMP